MTRAGTSPKKSPQKEQVKGRCKTPKKGGRDDEEERTQRSPKKKVPKAEDINGLSELFQAIRIGVARDIKDCIRRLGEVPLPSEDTPWKHTGSGKRQDAIIASKINLYDHIGDTALHMAARQGNAPVCELLLKYGFANANHPREDGVTPLFIATSLGHVDVARALIQAGGGQRNFQYDAGYIDPSAPNPFLNMDPAVLEAREKAKADAAGKGKVKSTSKEGGKGKSKGQSKGQSKGKCSVDDVDEDEVEIEVLSLTPTLSLIGGGGCSEQDDGKQWIHTAFHGMRRRAGARTHFFSRSFNILPFYLRHFLMSWSQTLTVTIHLRRRP